MSFWSDYSLGSDNKGFEPKRKFTFFLSFAGPNVSIENYLIKKVKKPGFEISESEHKFLNHTFYYPGKVKWKEVTFTVVDVISPNTTHNFMKLLEECGYRAPKGPAAPDLIEPAGGSNAQTISKNRSVASVGKPRITQVDSLGITIEEWVLEGAWIKDVEFGELDYDGEELMSIDVTLRYDWAYLEVTQPVVGFVPSNAF